MSKSCFHRLLNWRDKSGGGGEVFSCCVRGVIIAGGGSRQAAVAVSCCTLHHTQRKIVVAWAPARAATGQQQQQQQQQQSSGRHHASQRSAAVAVASAPSRPSNPPVHTAGERASGRAGNGPCRAAQQGRLGAPSHTVSCPVRCPSSSSARAAFVKSTAPYPTL
ncbi:hypothetical protein EJ04DRAFT_251833 [Polyplosphaeria fusca]|uniref:Uncharacterized protein n=1 Tax=Polyplosphaeria fusca TaxID=682080 RepID=A0A9P4QZ19_9PLEO|nr:hypothetical protein EJ04DRAFT_251833 [Polyplosphaeria fusca]